MRVKRAWKKKRMERRLLGTKEIKKCAWRARQRPQEATATHDNLRQKHADPRNLINSIPTCRFIDTFIIRTQRCLNLQRQIDEIERAIIVA
jgi:hypothetical protein